MSKRKLVIYALPGFVLAFPTLPLYILLPSYYALDIGLGLTLVGLIFLGLRAIDVISDPLIGYIMVRFPKGLGQIKVTLLIGCICAAPSVWMLLTPTDYISSGDAGGRYLFIWGALLFIGWSFIQIPYLAWVGLLSTNPKTRISLSFARETAGLAGVISFALLGYLLADLPEPEKLRWMAVLTLGLGVICFTLPLIYLPNYQARPHPFKAHQLPLENKLFWRLLGAWTLNAVANGLPAVCFPIFITLILHGNDADQAYFLLLYFSAALLGIPFWIYLTRFMDKQHVWGWSMLLACLAFSLTFMVDAHTLWLFTVICLVTGFTLGADLSLPPAIQADCVDWDRYRFSQERGAFLYALWGMCAKAALGLSVLFAFPALEFLGLDNTQTTQPETAIWGIYLIYAGLPIVLKLSAVKCVWHYPLTRRTQAAVTLRLHRRNQI